MFDNLRELRDQIVANGLLAQLFAIGGFILALFVVAWLIRQKRAAGS
jgi:hypothetical protein